MTCSQSARSSRAARLRLELTRFGGRQKILGKMAPQKESTLGKITPPYPAESRAEAVRSVWDGSHSVAKLARDLGCTSESPRQWVRQSYLDQGRRVDGLSGSRTLGATCARLMRSLKLWGTIERFADSKMRLCTPLSGLVPTKVCAWLTHGIEGSPSASACPTSGIRGPLTALPFAYFVATAA